LMVSALNHAMNGIGEAAEKKNYSLIFDGDKLSVINTKTGEIVYSQTASSGKGEHMNNPASQHLENVGPIPEGTYSYKNSNWKTLSRWQQIKRLATGTDWGSHNVPLEIINNKQPHRGNFYLHGGVKPGSSGCLDAGMTIGKIYQLTKHQTTTFLIIKY